jgi:hypothetical protein
MARRRTDKEALRGKWLRIWREHLKEVGGFCMCGLKYDLFNRQAAMSVEERRSVRLGVEIRRRK